MKHTKYRVIKRTLGNGDILFSPQKKQLCFWIYFYEYIQAGVEAR